MASTRTEKGQLVYTRTFCATREAQLAAEQAAEWKRTWGYCVSIRSFKRSVKADRVELPLIVLIVRESLTMIPTPEMREQMGRFAVRVWGKV